MEYDVNEIKDPGAKYWVINMQNGKEFINNQLSAGDEVPEGAVIAYNKAVRNVRQFKKAKKL